jgi:hypothetical protein
MDIDRLTAIDVHVHLEVEGELEEADKVAQQYFRTSAPREWKAQAEYYRSRHIGCVVFTAAVLSRRSRRVPLVRGLCGGEAAGAVPHRS